MFVGYDGEFDGAVEALDECIEIISQLKHDDDDGATALAQQRLQTLSTAVLAAMNSKQMSLYGPTITSLAQLAVSADQDAVDQILDLLYRLKDEFAKAQSYDQDAEDAAQAAHEEYVA
jgi:flagellin-specific chaperone FliS